ncbi:type I-E CRISPR-associated protein Cas7/Cse4/CasC [Corynebacterium yudongzhengii]|uniref:Type I-E CRISPR-associated protein Cas7/Cse4/CasC n=1 Tax=Corynebacterium yudongzhengii TaxID=2080740 RepID=A0A2U1T419_9CORY|nr:type I-E CRISPR-associated protein Cas7/Cse4/CasC [Corynebacterium yudongzhengii]AWB82407.1 type I-E CRISPR-associated protein Cas7/Cse4/CasC [Corynebacterium yudongzhengii]PWC00741.1 type I-E CRISPR-associated protein Cas7/Cse4/CasC [Corynebacterium yudongzhengii]
MSHHLTINIVSAIPFSNLNRDDTGTPKRINQGGVMRALLSSQSIKRGIRKRYEDASQKASVRSGELSEAIAQRAVELVPETDGNKALKEAKKIINKLTKGSETEGESARSIWLSQEEINTAAQTVANILSPDSAEEKAEIEAFIDGTKTGSLAIAAFGRMFANAPQNNTEAALSVSPAVTTHATSIDTDYFSTVDDLREERNETGATFLGVSQYTNGVFYRSVSIDKKQLRKSWSAFNDEDSRQNLEQLIRAVIYGSARGKEHSTAPYTLPAVVLVEEQRYRTAYDFETPVAAEGQGGYLAGTVDELAKQYQRARDFDAGNFGPVEALAGTYPELDGKFGDLHKQQLDDVIREIVDWIYHD